jgi:hypothetical protein
MGHLALLAASFWSWILHGSCMLFSPSPDVHGHSRTNWDNWGFVDDSGWHMYYIVGGECSGRCGFVSTCSTSVFGLRFPAVGG